MIRKISYSSQFKKDYQRIQKQGKDLNELKQIVTKLMNGEILETKCKDFPLPGNSNETRYCYIDPDWFLIYRMPGNASQLEFVRHLARNMDPGNAAYNDPLLLKLHLLRTGTQTDLFKK